MDMHLRPARVVPPGRIVKRELEAHGWTQRDLAEIVGRPEQAISEIVQGHKQITPETALQLAAAFGTSADFWLNLEINYQLYQVRQGHDKARIARKSRLYSLVPVAELIKRGWIKDVDSLEALEWEVCDFLEIATLDEQPRLAVNLRQAELQEPEVIAQIAWIKRVEHLARAQNVGVFDRERLQAAIPDLLAYAARVEDVTQVPVFLQSLGIRFVIVPHLPHTYLDGAAFTEGQPIVALTLRYDRIDSFWFTLLHELAHLIAGHAGLYLDDLDRRNGNIEEVEANRIAQDWLIEPAALARFIATTQPHFSRARVLAFAADQRRHPGIVLGRLQYDELVTYKNLRMLLGRVKPYLESWIDVPAPV